MNFTHLHVHSHYSLLDGMSKVNEIVDKCIASGMNAVALTDHGNMYGIKELLDYCKKINKKRKEEQLPAFKPIVGVETYCARRGRLSKCDEKAVNAEGNTYVIDRSGWHLILLAKNKVGYHNLCRIVSASFMADAYYHTSRIDKELLEQYHEGIICCSACLGGELAQKVMKGLGRVESQESRVESQEVMGWVEAHRQVYYSKLAGLITPWRLGEYPARGLLMQKNSLSREKEQVSSKTLWTKVLTMGAVGSATMTIAIVIGGLIGLAVVGSPVNLGDNYIIILLGVLVGAVLLIAAGWKIRTVILSSYSSPSVDRRLTVGLILMHVLQSMVRLLCWCVQLGLLLYALDGIPGMPGVTGVTGGTGIPGMPGVTGVTGGTGIPGIAGLTAIYYLLVTITPNVPIVEVGVRGAWAIAVFGSPQAAMAAVVLWVINTLLPCVGWLFLRKKTIKFA